MSSLLHLRQAAKKEHIVLRHNGSKMVAQDGPKLDRLIGEALLDEVVRRRLVDERDGVLFEEHQLSPIAQAWLHTIRAASLIDLARAIMSLEEVFYASQRYDHSRSVLIQTPKRAWVSRVAGHNGE